MTDSLLDAFERALAGLCTDEQVRRSEAGEDADAQWQAIDALGFTDALVPAEQGGAGLSLHDAFPLFAAAGRAGLSHPFAETVIARALLAAAGHAHRGECLAIATAQPRQDDAIVCREVPGALLAHQVLVAWRGEWLLLPRALAQTTPGAWRPQASASLRWSSAAQAVFRTAADADADATAICNAAHAAGMAGAMARVQAMSIAYVNDRRQFGRAISQFQAMQQELSVLAEQADAAAFGARLGCAGAGFLPRPLLAAAAKLRCAEAASRVAAIAHAVHGAIGITEALALGLFTRRLHEWRACGGTETDCATALGDALFAQHTGAGQEILDFVRLRLAPASA
ncbi:Acetyl-CoA acetyltransferase [Cupriavidus taiwanensis]|uniref:Acetyl-CoA acetyltransferase n=1 Tax=Cupriavidus taiwanensis TaxID=164546 RepID=A0A375E710_9BURK|nr:acyl-CoA dehydrogenase family protein [Cupriavidus taiwanensis]SOZ64490.1 Acetyl-CoA acetyltransferase [Cupriavidus taiwanensis]SOZ65199.1 Acetyl-CoA acetyltransferase [Cupriavidus taiwanensis]SOZ68837.1 Acetyl-CoA acetyltransferase [Cupriavidus taiwanensis]SPA08275.1 Acetyl-CoA acetyltransferase [Cupriavidus taiwanensis]